MEQTIKFWKTHANQALAKQIDLLNPEQTKVAFGQALTFGTSGLRAIMGPGPGYMNIYNVIKVTYGLAKFLLKNYSNHQKITVVIGSDNRHFNDLFVKTSAKVLSSFNIQVYWKLNVPTPLVSFAVRELQAQAGIVITASHNPPNYNGYKVYDQMGSAFTTNQTKQISTFANEHKQYLTYQYNAKQELIWPLPEVIINNYLKKVEKIARHYYGNNLLKIAFSPLHGTSAKFLPSLLRKLGHQVACVDQQMSHDPNFTYTKSANPEEASAYELGLKLAKEQKSDILLLTDPDADRLGLVVKNDEQFEHLSGNQVALIMIDYLLNNLSTKQQAEKGNYLVVNSLVSSELALKIAAQNNLQVVSVDTGFKWIAEAIKKYNQQKLLLAFEQSCGYLIDPNIAYDKDALQASVLISTIASKAKAKGQTLQNLLQNIYQKYGYEKEYNYTFACNEEQQTLLIKKWKIIKTFFANKVIVEDYRNGWQEILPTKLLKFRFDQGWIALRPSGTESKIKFYVIAQGKDEKLVNRHLNILKNHLAQLVNLIKNLIS